MWLRVQGQGEAKQMYLGDNYDILMKVCPYSQINNELGNIDNQLLHAGQSNTGK